MKKILLIVPLIILLTGCASWVIQPQQVVLLPEDRIFTVPAGQKIDVVLDKKPISMTFPNDMKLVSSTLLVRQEQQLNDTTFKKIQAEKKNSGIMNFLTVLFAAFGGAITLWAKNKVTTPKKV